MKPQIRKGDIFYIYGSSHTGCEIATNGRPAVVVSNDLCNKYAAVVEVVYLTTRRKRHLPTHVRIRSAPRPSIAMCEQISSVSVLRIGRYAGKVSKAEMEQIERAMMISLAMKG